MTVRNVEEGSVRISVGGQDYTNFLSLTLHRARRDLTAQGTLVLSWPGTEHFSTSTLVAPAFGEGKDAMIYIDEQLAAAVTFDKRISKGSPKHYELTLQFRGKGSVAVDSMPRADMGIQFNRQKPQEIVKAMFRGLPVNLIDNTGDFGKVIERFIYAEGETIERAARRAAREFGINLWENPQGNIIMDTPKTRYARGGPITMGVNLWHWSVDRDIAPRFREMMLSGSGIPTDDKYGRVNESVFSHLMNESNMDAEARNFRGLIYGDHDQQSADNRNEYEGGRRSQQGLTVTARMSTFSDANGTLWTVGARYPVSIPVDRVEEELELETVDFEITPESRSATLTLTGDPTNALSTFFDRFGRPRGDISSDPAEQRRENEELDRQAMINPANDQPQQTQPTQLTPQEEATQPHRDEGQG